MYYGYLVSLSMNYIDLITKLQNEQILLQLRIANIYSNTTVQQYIIPGIVLVCWLNKLVLFIGNMQYTGHH